jgi:hypothetical protein
MIVNGIEKPMSIKPHHDALLKIMLVMSTADGERPDKELNMIAELTRNLPVFHSVTADDLILATRAATVLLEEADSIDDLIEETVVLLPKPLRETAYALAVEVAAVDLLATEEELRLLELLRDTLNIDTLLAAAIEASARVRYRRDMA